MLQTPVAHDSGPEGTLTCSLLSAALIVLMPFRLTPDVATPAAPPAANRKKFRRSKVKLIAVLPNRARGPLWNRGTQSDPPPRPAGISATRPAAAACFE